MPKVEGWRQENGEPGEPDLLVRIPGWKEFYLDVTVVFPTAGKPGAAARRAEGEKKRKYPVWLDGVKQCRLDFYPVAFEAFGRLGEDASFILRKLALRSAADRDLEDSAEVHKWREILGLRLQLEQANILLRA